MQSEYQLQVMEDNKVSFGKNEKTCLIEAIKKANSYKNLKVKLE